MTRDEECGWKVIKVKLNHFTEYNRNWDVRRNNQFFGERRSKAEVDYDEFIRSCIVYRSLCRLGRTVRKWSEERWLA